MEPNQERETDHLIRFERSFDALWLLLEQCVGDRLGFGHPVGGNEILMAQQGRKVGLVVREEVDRSLLFGFDCWIGLGAFVGCL